MWLHCCDATSGRQSRHDRGSEPRHDRASEPDDWDCVDVLVDEESCSQAMDRPHEAAFTLSHPAEFT